MSAGAFESQEGTTPVAPNATFNRIYPKSDGRWYFMSSDGIEHQLAIDGDSLTFQGAWDADTNTPTLSSGVGTKGYYYVVSVAGTTNLDGITDWQPGDWALFSGNAYQKIDNTDQVSSVFGRQGAVIAQLGDYNAALIEMARVAGSTFSTVQHMQDVFHSVGWSSGGLITNAGGGNIDVSVGTGFIRAAAIANSEIKFTNWLGMVSQAIPSGTTRYIGVEWSGGVPKVVIKSTYSWNLNTEFPLGNVVEDNGNLHIENSPHAVGDHARFMLQRLFETMPLQRDEKLGGLLLSELVGRNISVTAGALWQRLTRFPISAINTSGVGSFDTYYRNGGGGWTEVAGIKVWPNTLYDNDSGSLVVMMNNRYANLWFYLELDGGLLMVYGQSQHTSEASAEAELPPTNLPDRITVQSLLIGRIIFQKSSVTAESIESVFTTVFGGAIVSDHLNLSNVGVNTHAQIDTHIADTNNPHSLPWDMPVDNLATLLLLPTPATGETRYVTSEKAAFQYNGTDWEGLLTSFPWNQVSRLHVESIDGATYTLDPKDDTVLLFDTTGGPVTVTLPLASAEPVRSRRIKRFLMFHLAGDNPVNVVTASPGVFPRGNTKRVLPTRGGLEFGVGNNGTLAQWIVYPVNTVGVSLSRNVDLADASWAVPTPLPWLVLNNNENDTVFGTDIGGANPSRITALVDLDCIATFFLSIVSIGGGVWSATAELRVNGTPIANSLIRTGNFGEEDQSLSMPRFKVSMSAGDYLEVWIDNDALLGDLVNADVVVTAEI